MTSQATKKLCGSAPRALRDEIAATAHDGRGGAAVTNGRASGQTRTNQAATAADPANTAQQSALGFLLAAAARCSGNGSSSLCPGDSETWYELSAHYGSHAMQRATAISMRRRRALQSKKRAWLLISASTLRGRYLCKVCGAWLMRRRTPGLVRQQRRHESEGLRAAQQRLVCPHCLRASVTSTSVHAGRAPSPSLPAAACEKKPCRRKHSRKARVVGAKLHPPRLSVSDASQNDAVARAASKEKKDVASALRVAMPPAKQTVGAQRRRVTVDLDASLMHAKPASTHATPASAPPTSGVSGSTGSGTGRTASSPPAVAAPALRRRVSPDPSAPSVVKGGAKRPVTAAQPPAKGSSGNLWDSLGL